jgi:NTP pyrophosphatase (non-canonical NTP hydrolase)
VTAVQTGTGLEFAATTPPASPRTYEQGREDGLTFAAFGAANRERCETDEDCGGFGRRVGAARGTLDALAYGIGEEAGETLGALRGYLGMSKHKPKTVEDVGDEIADLVSYCDLLAQAVGTSLATVLVRKWNRVSERRGYPGRLPTQTPATLDERER